MYIPSIGLEIHIFLNSETKVFSPEKINETSWISLGFPGTLPSLNLDSVKKTIRLSSLLKCQINYGNIVFDRKNYFYHDLPKGYQITQYFHPIGKSGSIALDSGKKIRIRQVHLEEDTAQQFRSCGKIHLNFERLGRPLVEIVTEPDFENYQEIEEFLQKLRSFCLFNKISTVRYEEGEMRVDLNLSVRENPNDPLSIKSEVKNLNSLFAIESSMEYVLNIQKENLKNGKPNDSLTYTWIFKRKCCEPIRKKSTESDYFYVPEANIPKISLTKEQYEEITVDLIHDFSDIRKEMIEQGLKDVDVDNMFGNYELFSFANNINKKLGNWSLSYSFVNVLSGLIDSLSDLDYQEIEKVIVDVEVNKKISLRMAKDIFKMMIHEKCTYKQASKSLKVSLIKDPDSLLKMIKEALEKYSDQMSELSSNLPKLHRLIIGECMKKSKGQADPVELNRILEDCLKKLI